MRRDVRRFRRDALPDGLLDELLRLACLSPSVGFSQPWRWVTVDSPEKRAAVVENFRGCNQQALGDFEGDKAALYARLKLAGMIWDAEGAEAVAVVRAWLKSERWNEAMRLRPPRHRTYRRQPTAPSLVAAAI